MGAANEKMMEQERAIAQLNHTLLQNESSDTLKIARAKTRGPQQPPPPKKVILPRDKQYDELRKVWNACIDRKPSMIVRCKCTKDVVDAVLFAREHHLEVTVRGGGHNVSGSAVADDAMLIDLMPMREVKVDEVAKTATVQGGATWSDLDGEAYKHRLVTPGGMVSETGVAGLTLGGGIGWLSRRYGLACDNLLEVELVLADGRVVKTSNEENPDLFWGGGGNFGIATSLKFKLYPLPRNVLLNQLIFRMDRAKEVLAFYVEFVKTLPDSLSSYLWFVNDTKSILLTLFSTNYNVETGQEDRAEYNAALKKLTDMNPLIPIKLDVTYPELQAAFDSPNRWGRYFHWKSFFLDEFTIELADKLCEALTIAPPGTTIELMHLGGKIQKGVELDSTAFYHREANFEIHSIICWDAPQDDQLRDEASKWSRETFTRAVEPHSRNGSGYLNILELSKEDSERAMRCYGTNHERLQLLKAKWDPHNFFHHNHNIKPAQIELRSNEPK